MKRLILGLAVTFGGLATASAENDAAPGLETQVSTRRLETGAEMIGPSKGYVIVDPPGPEAASAHFSRILFLNRCAGGCTVTYGTDNSSNNRSSIAQGTLSPFEYGDSKWNQVVQ